MIHKEYMRPANGALHLTAYNTDGLELWSWKQSNLIVSGAYPITAGALAGNPDSFISKVAVGTNGTIPVESDAQITGSAVVNIQTVEYPQPGIVRFNFTFGYYDAVGMSIREFGLLSADGRLFARKVREPIEKTKYMSIVGEWEITI